MMKLRVGDWVEVRSKEEILRTLDMKGCLEELPFMTQMFQYCGHQFRIYKRAHKTCDTVTKTGGRRLSNGVHLDTRCDGEAYGGCQAACLIFWKDAWLKPVDKRENSKESLLIYGASQKDESTLKKSCSEEDVWMGTHAETLQENEEGRYICQATQLPYFTTLLPWWDLRQYIEDYSSENVTLKQMFNGFVYAGFYIPYSHLCRIWWRFGLIYSWLYDMVQALWGGLPFPRKGGSIPAGQPTPTRILNLQPGELVRVRSYEEILATLDTDNKNRGLRFDAELVPYCGGTYRVRSRVNKFIDENTGKLVKVKNAAIILEDVVCQARYSDCRLFCPRSIYPWWREAWLERISESTHC
jgi:hypothetical protein